MNNNILVLPPTGQRKLHKQRTYLIRKWTRIPELFWEFVPINQMIDNLRNDSGRQRHYYVIKLLSANISKHRRAIRPLALVESKN